MKTPAIDYVSPLPPVRSGISDYSADLLPHLDRHVDLRVVRLPGQPVSPEMEERWHPVSSERLGEPRPGSSGSGSSGSGSSEMGRRLPLYQMGNNVYHLDVREIALRQPGVLTLHDLILHHLLLERTINSGDYGTYRRELEREHGWYGTATAAPRQWPGGFGNASHFFLPANRQLLRRQKGILVHSGWAAGEILAADPDLRVRAVPMGIPLPEAADKASGIEFRQRHGLPLDQPVLGSFGFQTPIKRTHMVVEALARPELSKYHLVIVGETTPIMNLEGLAKELGVDDRVHIFGFLDYGQFEAAISACDLCLNLRYPTAGETSASLLRVLAVGRPAVVSDYAQFSDLPSSIAVRVPLGEGEVEALVTALEELVQEPRRLEEMGHAARRFIAEHHDPDRAAGAVAEACRRWIDLPLPVSREVEAAPMTTAMRYEPKGTLQLAGADDPWRVGERRQLGIRMVNTGALRWLATKGGRGGVFIKTQWHDRKENEPLETLWLRFDRPVDPGDSIDFELTTRRPIGAHVLVVEPYLKGVGGFFALNGPVWESRFE